MSIKSPASAEDGLSDHMLLHDIMAGDLWGWQGGSKGTSTGHDSLVATKGGIVSCPELGSGVNGDNVSGGTLASQP